MRTSPQETEKTIHKPRMDTNGREDKNLDPTADKRRWAQIDFREPFRLSLSYAVSLCLFAFICVHSPFVLRPSFVRVVSHFAVAISVDFSLRAAR